MPHDLTLISTLAVGFALALICGFLANRLGSSLLVGYLVAGVAVGPFTPASSLITSSPASWPRSASCC